MQFCSTTATLELSFFKAWQDYLGFQECKCILKSLINYNMWQTPGKVNFGFSRLNINFHNRLQSVLWPKNFPMTRKTMFHSYFLYEYLCNFMRYKSFTIFICETIINWIHKILVNEISAVKYFFLSFLACQIVKLLCE